MLWLPVVLTLVAAMDAPASGSLTDALVQEEMGDSQGALDTLQALIRASPASSLLRLEAARLRLKLGGDLEETERDLDVVANSSPHTPQLHYLRGLVWEERGKPLHAVRSYEEALQERPSYEEARFRLAGVCASNGDWLKAELHYRWLANIHPEWVQVRQQLAQAVENQGRVADAEKLLLQLKDEQPTNAGVLLQLARLYDRTGREREASKLRGTSLKPPEPPKKMRPLKPSRR